MKVLFIAPLPPPLAGHSLVAKVFFDGLSQHHDVIPVDFNKESFVEGISSFGRVFEIFKVLKQVWIRQKESDRIYLTISESLAGNLKDLFIYLICYRKLNKFYIHLHGGSIKKLLWDKYSLIHWINRFFIKKMAGAIISGESHREVFSHILPPKKIHIVVNFALEYLFSTIEDVEYNFTNIEPIKLLYISNMIDKKGYLRLTNAYLSLEPEVRRHFKLDLAGRFELESQKEEFLSIINHEEGICYHGLVDEEQKKNLFSRAHIFCLPTAFFEGQPVSILEAYATGTVVLTTPQSGILDIFIPNENGYVVQPDSSESIKNELLKILHQKAYLKDIAKHNLQLAINNYQVKAYNENLLNIIGLPIE